MNANKRIAVNTGVIYFKLIISAAIGLFTTRILLQALGANDYGLYSVVGGIVTFLNIIGTTMVSVSNRFIAVELGKGKNGDPNKVFNSVLIIHLVLAMGLLFIGETLGIFYIDNYLNVLPEKIPDARFVLHVSLVTTALSIITVPFHGLIIAREKFVFISSVEISTLIMKLLLVVLLASSDGNRLRYFAIIMAFVSVVTQVSYQTYCRIKDHEITRWHFNSDRQSYKGLFSFASWSLFGAVAYVGKEQGTSVIINFFFGTTLNAAFGLASQINRYAMMFTKGLSQAASPQIMKSYGSQDNDRSLTLVYNISRISTLIMLIIVEPLCLCMNEVLAMWLGTPPDYTTIFAQFMLINTLVSMLGAGFDACILSTGKIKKNEIWTSIIYLSILPIIFVLYKLGFPPYMNVVIMTVLSFFVRVMQIFIMRQLTNFQFKIYMQQSFMPTMRAAIISFLPLYIVKQFWTTFVDGTFAYMALSILWIIFCIFTFGIQREERIALWAKFLKKNKKI